MSIDEAAALKAVRDGLEGRNVPIVHEEIRVVLAMALERDALKARVETAERDLDIARGLIARLGDPDSLESLWALLRYERARVAELERAQDAAFRDAHRAEADAARLREALEEVLCRPEPGQVAPCPCRRCHIASAALASAPSAEPTRCDACAPEFSCFAGDAACVKAPSAEPTPRDMRVAEAVQNAERLRCLRVGDAMNTLNIPQPAPVTDDAGPEVWPALLAEVAMSPELAALCEERDAFGRAKYGTALRVHNGREPLVDALQEALDLAVYLQQAMMRSNWRGRRDLCMALRDSALLTAQAILNEVTP